MTATTAPSTTSEPTMLTLLDAINFAAIQHRNQRRKDSDQTPYINHPIGVMHILTHEAGVTDIITLCAAVLHDTVEDTETSYEMLVDRFGKTIADVVMECTDDKKLSPSRRKQAQIDHVCSGHMTLAAKQVKLADKCYNLRDIVRSPPASWTVERVQGYFIWANTVVGHLHGINPQLDEQLQAVCSSKVTVHGQTVPCIPFTGDPQQLLQVYYKSLDK